MVLFLNCKFEKTIRNELSWKFYYAHYAVVKKVQQKFFANRTRETEALASNANKIQGHPGAANDHVNLILFGHEYYQVYNLLPLKLFIMLGVATHISFPCPFVHEVFEFQFVSQFGILFTHVS